MSEPFSTSAMFINPQLTFEDKDCPCRTSCIFASGNSPLATFGLVVFLPTPMDWSFSGTVKGLARLWDDHDTLTSSDDSGMIVPYDDIEEAVLNDDHNLPT